MTGVNELKVTRLSTVRPERVEWLWPGRLPIGKLVVLDGDPGTGKSTLALDLAARVSTASPMPDGARLDRPSSVIIMSAEDGLGDTIRPRLDAAGADPERIYSLDGVWYEDEDGADVLRSPEIPRDRDRLAELVARTGARLVIVDVLNAFLSGKVDGHKDQDIRTALMPMAKMAAAAGCCVLVVRHLNKSGGNNPLYRGGGSIGIIGAARVGLIVGADPDDDTRRILAVPKCNLAAIAPSLAYRLIADDEHGCARVQWEGATTHTAADLVSTRLEADDDTTDAAAVLAEILADGPVWVKQAMDRMADAGFTKDQAKRAKQKLRAQSIKVGKPGDAEQGWQWSPPRRVHEESEECGSQNPALFAPFVHPSLNGHAP